MLRGYRNKIEPIFIPVHVRIEFALLQKRPFGKTNLTLQCFQSSARFGYFVSLLTNGSSTDGRRLAHALLFLNILHRCDSCILASTPDLKFRKRHKEASSKSFVPITPNILDSRRAEESVTRFDFASRSCLVS